MNGMDEKNTTAENTEPVNLFFSAIAGNRALKTYLQKRIESRSVGHAYILAGEPGSGRRMTAEAFASALLCEQGGTEACGTCLSCGRIRRHNHTDLIYTTHEKPGIITIDDVRRQIIDGMDVGPSEGYYKIFLVEDADLMNPAAQNALLKTIEEPPEWAVILMIAENPDRFLETVRSRCTILRTAPIDRAEEEAYLMKHCGLPDYAASFAAAFSEGNIGRAIRISSSEEFRAQKKLVVTIMSGLKKKKEFELEGYVAQLKQDKDHIGEILDLMEIWLRDVLLYKSTASDRYLIYSEDAAAVKRNAETMRYSEIGRCLDEITHARERLRANVGFETTMSVMFAGMKG